MLLLLRYVGRWRAPSFGPRSRQSVRHQGSRVVAEKGEQLAGRTRARAPQVTQPLSAPALAASSSKQQRQQHCSSNCSSHARGSKLGAWWRRMQQRTHRTHRVACAPILRHCEQLVERQRGQRSAGKDNGSTPRSKPQQLLQLGGVTTQRRLLVRDSRRSAQPRLCRDHRCVRQQLRQFAVALVPRQVARQHAVPMRQRAGPVLQQLLRKPSRAAAGSPMQRRRARSAAASSLGVCAELKQLLHRGRLLVRGRH
jgi:hypothetical protein